MPVEAIVVLHEAESRCAVWHGLELFLFYSLAFKIVVVDFVPFRGKKDACFKVFPRVAFFFFGNSEKCSWSRRNNNHSFLTVSENFYLPLKKITESLAHSG